jgi:hypothetical protein
LVREHQEVARYIRESEQQRRVSTCCRCVVLVTAAKLSTSLAGGASLCLRAATLGACWLGTLRPRVSSFVWLVMAHCAVP